MKPELEPTLPDVDSLRRQLRSRNRGEGYRAADQLAEIGPEGRSLLLKALESRDRNVRLHAAWAARKLNSANAVIKLIELLREDPEFYLPLQQCLSRPGQPRPSDEPPEAESELLEPLVAAAKDLRNPQRKFHMMLLGDLSNPEIIDTLLIGIQNDDLPQQEGAFLALKHACRSLREAAAPGLVQALSVRLPLPAGWKWTWTARQKASQSAPLSLIAAVGLVSGEAAVGVLCEILRSSCHPQYRLAAISALITVGEAAVGRSARSLVQQLQAAQDNLLAQAAAEALRRLRAEVVEGELVQLLESPLPFQRRHAADALEGCAHTPDAFARLTRLALSDSDVHVRRTAVRAVSRPPQREGPPLRGAAGGASEGPPLRGAAGGASEVFEWELLQALEDKDRWVAWNAAWMLGQRWKGKTPPARMLDMLLQMLEAPLARVRRATAEALGQMAASSPEVVEALVASLADPRSEVCRSAAWGLRQIDLTEALAYASVLRSAADRRQRDLGQKAIRWLQPRFSSYTPHQPIRSSALTGVFDEV